MILALLYYLHQLKTILKCKFLDFCNKNSIMNVFNFIYI
jgi:hypothetical protein